MSRTHSTSESRSFGVRRAVRITRTPRASDFRDKQRREGKVVEPQKRGPKTEVSDAQLLEFIRLALDASPFVGERHRKAWARLRAQGVSQGVRDCFGSFDRDAASGLTVRHDNDSQYVSKAFQDELAFLGIRSSPSFVRSPEGNGVAERFIRTLKE